MRALLKRSLNCQILLMVVLVVADQAVAAEQVATQVPQVVASTTDRQPAVAAGAIGGGTAAPKWIWGAKSEEAYVLRTTFKGTATSALLRASADNVVTIFVNGQKVGASSEWQNPVAADIAKYLKGDENEILAEVKNEGGIAGFVLQLILKDAAGATRAIVTDATWTAAPSRESADRVAVQIVADYGAKPWGKVLERTPADEDAPFQVPAGFRVERIYTVPREEFGSWVNLAVDPQGRLIASDQGPKGLFRITPGGIGTTEPAKVEKLATEISSAQGLLFAFDSLYVSVNGGKENGLFRLRDTNNDGDYEVVEKVRSIQGGGEHGPHALRLSPDGKSIMWIAGNHTDIPFSPGEVNTNGNTSRIMTNWNEDQLLPRQWDAGGHAVGKLAPGGWIARMNPDGTECEIVSMGYRNPFDMAFNADGELFAYDADMEWDFGTPWYRPTRVCHAVSGSEFGWRSGTGKWPVWYADSLPPVVNIGPGSPVGVTFGYGTKFPAKYQRALFLCDWTFGTLYAIHLTPDGASYTGEREDFVSRAPLPLTDAVVGKDGALYFTIGGRGLNSELFRLTYVGSESTRPVDYHDSRFSDQRAIRRKLESFHRPGASAAEVLPLAIPQLDSQDRFLRYAARIALEFLPVLEWQKLVLESKDPSTCINGAIGLARAGGPEVKPAILSALARWNWDQLNPTRRAELLRAYQLTFIRQGEATEAERQAVLAQLDSRFPSASDEESRELCTLLVYLRSSTIVGKATNLMQQPPRQVAPDYGNLVERNKLYGATVASVQANHPDMTQLHYALCLRNMKEGWTIDQRKAYFSWFERARTWSGGASYPGFLRNIDREAFEPLPEQEKLAIEAFGARKPIIPPALPKPIGPGKDWTHDELFEMVSGKIAKRNYEKGERAFAAARCIVCHRINGDGGATGPDLSNVAGRFKMKDIVEALIDPSKVISDQYKATQVELKNGKTIVGRPLDETPTKLVLVIDPENASKFIEIDKAEIETRSLSNVSLMPKDLLKQLNKDEVLDMMAFMLSGGNKRHAMFR